MRRHLPLVSLLLCAAAAQAAAPVRFPVSAASVTAALAAQRPHLTAVSVDVPPVMATSRDPELVVESVARAGVQTARVRVSCATASACLPFYATVHSDAPIEAAAMTVDASTARAHGGAEMPELRSGTHTRLVIDSGLLHITLPVIALGSGRIGDPVRVASLDRRLTYTGRIVSRDEVQGDLER